MEFSIFNVNFKFESNINIIKDQFVKYEYEKIVVETKIEKVEKLHKSVLLVKQNKIKKVPLHPLSVT